MSWFKLCIDVSVTLHLATVQDTLLFWGFTE